MWVAGLVILVAGSLEFGWDLVSFITYKLAAWMGVNPLVIIVIMAVLFVVLLIGGFTRILLSDSRHPR